MSCASSRRTRAFAPFRDGPLGNDEIAFDVSGIDIPCGSIMRGPFTQYHTEYDDPDHVDAANFEEMTGLVLRAINILEKNATLHRKFTELPRLSHPDLGLYLSPHLMSNVALAPDPVTRELIANLDDASLAALPTNGDTFNWLMT